MWAHPERLLLDWTLTGNAQSATSWIYSKVFQLASSALSHPPSQRMSITDWCLLFLHQTILHC